MSFISSLAKGKHGEDIYFEHRKDEIERLDGYKSDFRCIKTGKGLELKTDSWSLAKTPNYFFEHIRNTKTGAPGGPWQALASGSEIFVYMYVNDLTYFTFDTTKLVERLNEIIIPIRATNVYNASYITQGYKVPRDLLTDLATMSIIKPKES